MLITEFCGRYDACQPGRKWAANTGCSTMAELWERNDMPCHYRIWIATRKGVLDDRTLRLFAVWCCRRVWDLMTDEHSKHVVIIAELYALGAASEAELAAARDAAWAATWMAPVGATGISAWRAASAASWAADNDANEAASYASYWAASCYVTPAEHAQWLRDNTSPVFA